MVKGDMMAWDMSWCGTRKIIWKSFLDESAKNGFERERFLGLLHQEERLLDFEEDTMACFDLFASKYVNDSSKLGWKD